MSLLARSLLQWVFDSPRRFVIMFMTPVTAFGPNNGDEGPRDYFNPFNVINID
jgi:hypothetical protein